MRGSFSSVIGVPFEEWTHIWYCTVHQQRRTGQAGRVTTSSIRVDVKNQEIKLYQESLFCLCVL